MRKVTIEDISRDTGLSRGTVSRALNDRPDISRQTKQRVLEACKKLDYRPSHAARALATGRNYAVAALVDDLTSAFAASFLRGVIRRAQRARYVVHVIETGCEPEPDQLCSFSADRIDGVLSAVPLEAPLTARLREAVGQRALASCWPLEGVSCDVLTPDGIEAGRMAARFVARHHSTEPLYVHRPTGRGAAERLAGFQEVCRERGVDAEIATVTIQDLDAVEALGSRLEQAEAIIASDDFVAVAIMLCCARLGRRAGEDFAVIGHGNEPLAGEIRPTLTSVDCDGEEIGRRMMDTILERLDQKRMDAPQHGRVAPRLVERESTRQLVRSA
jgi:DNA-binding LacI/PurR family transcriptional regulator